MGKIKTSLDMDITKPNTNCEQIEPYNGNGNVAKTQIQDLFMGRFHCIRYLDTNDVEKTVTPLGVRLRKIISPILLLAFRTQKKSRIIVDDLVPLRRKTGNIFVVNHFQPDDIVIAAVSAGVNAWVVMGNPVMLFHSIKIGFGLWANGVILLRRSDKQRRKATYEKMKRLLELGGNIIVFPEGYWNLADDGQADACHAADGHNSENWPIQDFNIGAFRLAQEMGADIVPLVLHYDEVKKRRCYVRRCAPVQVASQEDVFAQKDAIWQRMVDASFEMMAKYSSYNRVELERCGKTVRQQWTDKVERFRSECDLPRANYVLDLAEEKRIGKVKVAKGVVTVEEVFFL